MSDIKKMHDRIAELYKDKKNAIGINEPRPTYEEEVRGSFECDACMIIKPLMGSVQFLPRDTIILCDSCWNTIHRLCNYTMCPIIDMVDGLKKKRTEHIQSDIDALVQIIERTIK